MMTARRTTPRRTRRVIFAALVVALLGAGGVVTATTLRGPRFASDEVARVDGRSIRSAELAAVAGAEGIPLDSTAQVRAAVTAAARFTVLEQLARQHGLPADTSYDAVLARMRQVNAQREAAMRSGRAVYGVAQFTTQSYLAQLNGSLRTTLIAKLVADGELSTSSARLEDYYDAHADEYAKAADDIRLRVLRFPADPAGQAAAAHALAALQSGRSVTTVAAADGSGVERVENLHIDQSVIGELSKYHSGELSVAQSLSPGASALVPDDISAEPLLLVCLSRKAGGVRPFSQMRAETKSRYERASLDQLISRRLSSMRLEVRPDLSAFVHG